ncbi:MAG: TIGR01212 family radical SAM protein [Lachnospiraceae bacterium]|nr:TIGR01212 family radical SAM protein [Lachnospiraceae bacterium]
MQNFLFDKQTRYYSFNEYCKQTFGQKVYRLSLNGGMSCPNRDGTLGTGGCTFCSEGGSGDFATDYNISIKTQIAQAKERTQAKTSCNAFIAYFQAYTNTYAPITHLQRIFTESIQQPEIVALSIGTRSDCLSDEVLDLLEKLSQIKPVWVELGLQTIHNQTLQHLNTHTTVGQFDSAVFALSKRKIPVIAHVILGLPYETKEMMLETVQHISTLPILGVKLQLLHILKYTQLALEYEQQPFPLFELEEYCDFIVDCLEYLPPNMVVHRLTGDGPRNLLIAPLWSTDKKRVLNTIRKKLKERNTFQGKNFSFSEHCTILSTV